MGNILDKCGREPDTSPSARPRLSLRRRDRRGAATGETRVTDLEGLPPRPEPSALLSPKPVLAKYAYQAPPPTTPKLAATPGAFRGPVLGELRNGVGAATPLPKGDAVDGLSRVPSAVSDDPHADVNLGSVVSLAARDSTAVDAEASSQAGPPAEPPAETSSIQWQRGELLGSGAFGQVFLGMNLETGELMAVKQVAIKGGQSEQQAAVARHVADLEEEVAILRRLKHPNIVRYLGTERTDSHLHIFLEFVPGGSIASLLARFGPFQESVIRMYTRQILLGLDYLHQNRHMHRDIKGANILVDNNGVVKLADFGASKKIESLVTMGDGYKSIKGTPYWMAPEVIKQEGHGRQADIWSIGCTVVEMATARPPWSHIKSQMSAMFHIANATEGPPVPDHLSPEAQDFLRLCFERRPRLRPNCGRLLRHPFVANALPKHSPSRPLFDARFQMPSPITEATERSPSSTPSSASQGQSPPEASPAPDEARGTQVLGNGDAGGAPRGLLSVGGSEASVMSMGMPAIGALGGLGTLDVEPGDAAAMLAAMGVAIPVGTEAGEALGSPIGPAATTESVPTTVEEEEVGEGVESAGVDGGVAGASPAGTGRPPRPLFKSLDPAMPLLASPAPSDFATPAGAVPPAWATPAARAADVPATPRTGFLTPAGALDRSEAPWALRGVGSPAVEEAASTAPPTARGREGAPAPQAPMPGTPPVGPPLTPPTPGGEVGRVDEVNLWAYVQQQTKKQEEMVRRSFNRDMLSIMRSATPPSAHPGGPPDATPPPASDAARAEGAGARPRGTAATRDARAAADASPMSGRVAETPGSDVLTPQKDSSPFRSPQAARSPSLPGAAPSGTSSRPQRPAAAQHGSLAPPDIQRILSGAMPAGATSPLGAGPAGGAGLLAASVPVSLGVVGARAAGKGAGGVWSGSQGGPLSSSSRSNTSRDTASQSVAQLRTQVLHMGKSLIQGLDEIIHGGGEGADNGGGSRAKAQQWEAELQNEMAAELRRMRGEGGPRGSATKGDRESRRAKETRASDMR